MREINIRKFRTNITKELESLPLVITRHGKKVALVSKCVEIWPGKVVHNDFSGSGGGIGEVEENKVVTESVPKESAVSVRGGDKVPEWTGGISKEKQVGKKERVVAEGEVTGSKSEVLAELRGTGFFRPVPKK